MNHKNILLILLTQLLFTFAASDQYLCAQRSMPRHVVLIGLDAMGGYGVQRARTPSLNRIIREGAWTIHARSVRPTESSPNWMSMVSGAIPVIHGVTDNGWMPNTGIIVPAYKNKKGLYPTLFYLIKEAAPNKKVHMFYEWVEQERMYDTSAVDKIVKGKTGEEIFREGMEDFFASKPDFSFISIVETDDVGHEHGHESQAYLGCIEKYDVLIGKFIDRLKASGMDKNTVILITADHGGLGHAHGDDSPAEYNIPIMLYGHGVTAGKKLHDGHLICDVAGTIAHLLGVKLAPASEGRFISEAFTFKEKGSDRDVYVAMPFVSPTNGMFRDSVKVGITSDTEGQAVIHYTLDGSKPGPKSPIYKDSLTLTSSAVVRAVAYKDGQSSDVGEADLRVLDANAIPKVHYALYDNYMGKSVPDFKMLGKPSRVGYVHEFSLDELGVDNKDHFAILFTSNLRIDSDGEYSFGVISDDGCKVYVGDKRVIDNDGSHSPAMKRGHIFLKKGVYIIKIEYFENYMGQSLQLYYGSDTIPMQTIPFSKLNK